MLTRVIVSGSFALVLFWNQFNKAFLSTSVVKNAQIINDCQIINNHLFATPNHYLLFLKTILHCISGTSRFPAFSPTSPVLLSVYRSTLAPLPSQSFVPGIVSVLGHTHFTKGTNDAFTCHPTKQLLAASVWHTDIIWYTSIQHKILSSWATTEVMDLHWYQETRGHCTQSVFCISSSNSSRFLGKLQ